MSFQSTATAQRPEDTPSGQEGDRVRSVDFEPVSRVAGALAFHTVVDFDSGTVTESASKANLFRGYEVILAGRDPRDAIFVSSRACGVCGAAHSSCSAQALEMAFGISPPAMGIVARNLLSAVENLYDDPTHLFLRAGPDYSEPVVRETNPELWTRAEQTAAPGRRTHGFAQMSDLLAALTLHRGRLYLEALDMARVAREAYVTVGGKHPHPQTIVPGGISSTVDPTDMNVALLRIVRFLDYSRKVAAVWDDVADFFCAAEPRFREVGAGAKNFLDPGLWDDPYAYDGTLKNASAWGERRWATPGAIVGGDLETTDLLQVDAGVEEFVDHAFYEDWTGGEGLHSTDPLGNPLSARHPWNKLTIPKPGAADLQAKYSWSTAARWKGQPMETGAAARLWITAMARKQPHRGFLDPTGRGLRLAVPQAEMPAGEVEWHVPETWNALERHRARAYSLVYSTLVAYENLVIAYDLARKAGPDARIFTQYKIPRGEAVGVGFWGSARGYVSHHVKLRDRVIENYQILGPSTFTASPRDDAGNPGPIESAVQATPLLSSEHPERCLDVLRAIRSFDPCLPCATH